MNIVIVISMLFLAFYIVAIFWSLKAYKEFKGALEDEIGADQLRLLNKQQNVIAYGLINNYDEPESQPLNR